MTWKTLPLTILVLVGLTTMALALPEPYSEQALEDASTLIIDGLVIDATCVGEPVTTDIQDGTVTVTTYESTLAVTYTYKGAADFTITIVGTSSEYGGGAQAPIGGWNQPPYGAGEKGKFYLEEAAEEVGGYTLVWWNGFAAADDSNPNPEFPDCGASVPVNLCADGVMGEDETDVDCGGAVCDACDAGKACLVDIDCASEKCVENLCAEGTPEPLPCADGVMNGDETDVDCGGACGGCADGKACLAGSDCTSKNCVDGLCAPGEPSSGLTLPNPCWEGACPAEYDACAASESCVAWNACKTAPEEEKPACFEAVAESDPEAIDPDSDNHTLYYALQECGWSNCNDPEAGSCGDPGKNGAVNRCGQYDDTWMCNCDDACEEFMDCCADRDEVCGGPPCVPDCGTKECGGDDGCGNSCGECGDGQKCSKANLCVACVAECTDACEDGKVGCDGLVPWTCGEGDDGCNEKVAADTCPDACTDGVCTLAESPEEEEEEEETTKKKDKGGCASSTPTQTGGIVLLGLVLLGLAVRRRRSFDEL